MMKKYFLIIFNLFYRFRPCKHALLALVEIHNDKVSKLGNERERETDRTREKSRKGTGKTDREK